MQRILAIDDDHAVTNLLKRGLHYEGYNVDTADSGKVGLEIARETNPDLVILDVMMPGLDGLEVLRRLRSADGKLPVVMLSAKDTPADQIQGLDTGADDYLVKPFTFEVLLAHIRALLRRQEAEPSAVLHYSDLSLDNNSHQVQRGQRGVALTCLEFKLLHEFIRHPQQVLSKNVLLDSVWGYDFGGDGNVVEVYVKQLRQKLEAKGEIRLIQTVRGVGYALREE